MSADCHILRGAARGAVVAYGVPAAVCVVGVALLLLPGASPLPLMCGWLVPVFALLAAYRRQPWSSDAGSWTLLVVSVVLALGIILNCHYYICVWGDGNPGAPSLVNVDASNAWNNALASIGEPPPGVPESWPAKEYGLFVGLLLRLFGTDICVPLLFNAFCALATIVLTGAVACGCSGGSASERRRVATCAIVMASTLCYFIASGMLLIKDCPLALAVALAAWCGLRARRGFDAALVAALVVSVVITVYCRPNYLLAEAAIVAALGAWTDRAGARRTIAVVVFVLIGWLVAHVVFPVVPFERFVDSTGRALSDDPGEISQHSFYMRLFHDYYAFSFAEHCLLLPVTAAIQFLIPLPWTWDKYLMFGPAIALAHFSFCRYAVGAATMYYLGAQFGRGRSSTLLLRLFVAGVALYLATAFQFGGTVSRYGIPLVSLLVPGAAYAWCSYRRRRSFAVWMCLFAAAMAVLLSVCYYLTI